MNIIPYEEKFGAVNLPEGFMEKLEGKTIEEQMKYYRTTCVSRYSISGWKERVNNGYVLTVDKDRDVRALIVKDGILVGVMIVCDTGSEVPLFAEENVCTYYASDNNGAGSKERIEYTYLLCVDDDFEK